MYTKNLTPNYSSHLATITNRHQFGLRTALLLAASVIFIQNAPAQNTNTLPFYEPFPTNYIEGEQLGSGFGFSGTANGTSGTNWITGNSVSGSSARIRAAASMAWPGLPLDPLAFGDIVNSRGLTDGSGTGKNRGVVFAPVVSNGAVYVSFLFNLQTNVFVNRLFACLSDTTGTGPNVRAGLYATSFGQLTLGKNRAIGDLTLPPGGAVSLIPSNTYLVVVRYRFNSGSTTNDEIALWLNPTPLGDNASIPPPNITTTNGTDAPSLQSFYFLRASSGMNAALNFWMDEIRVGTNWSDVTPATTAPGNIYSVTGGGAQCAGGSFPVGVSSSEAGVDYLLYTNGVYSGQTVSGTGSAVSFGAQTETAIYTVLASNTVSANVGWMKTNASVTIIGNPGVVTQPNSIVVANGALGVISVVASGDNLSYHWRRDGTNLADGGHYSGTTTPNLTIYPASAADVATTTDGYDVVITNTCGLVTATSSRVGLTLGTPADLVWYGDGVNLWDVATSTDWNTGTAVFNFGDNVTFDDSALYFSVILASPFLSPTKVTIDTSITSGGYSLTGNGSVIGPAVLIKNGIGTVAINAVNAYTGGTTISNGIILLQNPNALGTGTLTLAGGSLSIPAVQGSRLINPVDVVADSSILVADTSGNSLLMTNSLSGTSGTLTFVNNTSGRSPTIQLLYPGFVFNRPLVLDVLGPNGNGTNLFLQGQNTSGDQVLNGDISSTLSGAGQLRRSANGGRTILNGNNTYGGGTIVSGGTLWVNGQIGAGSPDFVTVQGGTLGGSGTINADVTMSGGTFAPGTSVISNLTINGNLTITNNLLFKVNKSVSPSNDTAVVSGAIANLGSGTLTVTNLGPALVAGNTFKLFNKAVSSGNLLTITGGGAGIAWNNNLTVDGSITVASVVTQPPLITSVSLSGGNIVISGTNGSVGATYYVVATTDLTLPRSQWTPVDTNTFGAGGSFTSTIPVSSQTPARFYAVQLP